MLINEGCLYGKCWSMSWILELTVAGSFYQAPSHIRQISGSRKSGIVETRFRSCSSITSLLGNRGTGGGHAYLITTD
ncbi:hypothetical protein AB1N83_007257 [Pleurotus pulmonarius]